MWEMIENGQVDAVWSKEVDKKMHRKIGRKANRWSEISKFDIKKAVDRNRLIPRNLSARVNKTDPSAREKVFVFCTARNPHHSLCTDQTHAELAETIDVRLRALGARHEHLHFEKDRIDWGKCPVYWLEKSKTAGRKDVVHRFSRKKATLTAEESQIAWEFKDNWDEWECEMRGPLGKRQNCRELFDADIFDYTGAEAQAATTGCAKQQPPKVAKKEEATKTAAGQSSEVVAAPVIAAPPDLSTLLQQNPALSTALAALLNGSGNGGAQAQQIVKGPDASEDEDSEPEISDDEDEAVEEEPVKEEPEAPQTVVPQPQSVAKAFEVAKKDSKLAQAEALAQELALSLTPSQGKPSKPAVKFQAPPAQKSGLRPGRKRKADSDLAPQVGKTS